ncbi:MAG: hypothetical protein RLY57_592 [Candidatus Parcubacteria bacterium]
MQDSDKGEDQNPGDGKDHLDRPVDIRRCDALGHHEIEHHHGAHKHDFKGTEEPEGQLSV